MDRLVQAAGRMVFADRRTSKRCRARCEAGELIRVWRSAYVEAGYLTGAPGRWEAQRRATAARALAVAHTLGPHTVISHETAAALHGVEMVSDLLPIHLSSVAFHGHGRVTDRQELPALVVPGREVISAVDIVRHRLDARAGAMEVGGLRVADLGVAVTQCTATLPPREATVVASGALRMMSSFDMFRQQASRVREEAVRVELLAHLESMPRCRGRVQAREVLSVSDAGCQTVSERVLLWILKAAGFRDVRTQAHHRVNGRDYYVDFELPWCHVVIEFDGEAKYGEAVHDIHIARRRESDRQKDLESIDLTVLRFRREELDSPAGVVAEVTRRAGLVHPPRRNSLLSDRARRPRAQVA